MKAQKIYKNKRYYLIQFFAFFFSTMHNPQRFSASQEHVRAQNIVRLQDAQILLSNPRYLNDLRKTTADLKMVGAEHVKVLQVLVNNPYDYGLKQQHLKLSQKIAALEAQIQDIFNQYNTILADAQSAQLVLQDDNVPFADRLFVAHSELQSLLPKQFVSSFNTKLTNLLQQQAPTRYLEELVTTYTEIVHISPYDHVDLEQILVKCEEYFLFLQNQNNILLAGFPNMLWTKFRTKTLPLATDRISQNTARIEAATLINELSELMQAIPPLPVFDVHEPNIATWHDQLQWLLWAKVSQAIIAWLLQEQQVYSLYISVLTAQRALGVTVDESLLTNARDHILALTQRVVQPQHKSPDFETTWNLLLADVANANIPQDSAALHRMLRAVQRSLQYLEASQPCVHDAQETLKTYLTCVNAICTFPKTSDFTRKCVEEFEDVSTELTELDNAIQQSIQNMQCENIDVCDVLKSTLLENHRLQIAFLQNSIKLVSKKQLANHLVRHEELRLHLPLLHVIGATPFVDQKRQVLLDKISSAFQDLALIYGISFALQAFPIFPNDNFPLHVLTDIENHVKNRCQMKTLSDIQACVMQYVPSVTYPALRGFVVTQDAAVQQYLTAFPLHISSFVNDVRKDIAPAHAALQVLRKAALSAYQMLDLSNLQLQETAAFAACDIIKEQFKVMMEELVKIATELHLEVLNNLEQACYLSTMQRVPYTFNAKLHCQLDFEHDLELHTSLQRKNFISACEALSEENCENSPTECIRLQALINEYKDNVSQPKDLIALKALTPNAVALYHRAQELKLEIQLQEHELEANFKTQRPKLKGTDIDLYDEVKSAAILRTSQEILLSLQQASTKIDDFYQQYMEVQTELDKVLKKFDELFLPIDFELLIFDKLSRVKKLTDQADIIYNVLDTLKAFDAKTFPIAHYLHLKDVVHQCLQIDPDQRQAVLDSAKTKALLNNSYLEPFYKQFVNAIDDANSSWSFDEEKRILSLAILPLISKITTTIAQASSELDKTTAFNELQVAENILLSMQVRFFKDFANFVAELQTKIVKAIINTPNEEVAQPSKMQIIDLCVRDLASDISKHMQKERMHFERSCKRVMESESCFKQGAKCPAYMKLVEAYDKVILPDISSHADFELLSAKVLKTNAILKAKRIEYLEMETEWRNAWKRPWLLANFDLTIKHDMKELQAFSDKVWQEYQRFYNSNIRAIEDKKSITFNEFVMLENTFQQESKQLDLLFVDAFKIEKATIKPADFCQILIAPSNEWDPTTRNDLLTECKKICVNTNSKDDMQKCIDAKIMPPAQKSQLPQAKSTKLDGLVEKIDDQRTQVEEKQDFLNLLKRDAVQRYNNLLNSKEIITEAQVSNANDIQTEIKGAEQQLLDATKTYETHIASYQQAYQDLVTQFKLPFGEAVFTQVKPPMLQAGLSKLSIPCETKVTDAMANYSESKRIELAKECVNGEQTCKSNLDPVQCLDTILANIKPSKNPPQPPTSEIQKLLQTNAVQNADTELLDAYNEWKKEIQTDRGDDILLKQLGSDYETKKNTYSANLVTMLIAQTMLDLEILSIAKPPYIYDNCGALFDTKNRLIEWSIPSRYTLISKCLQLCPDLQQQCAISKQLELLIEALAVDVSAQYDSNMLTKLTTVRQLLHEAYAQAHIDWVEIQVMRDMIESHVQELKFASLSLEEVLQKDSSLRRMRENLETLVHDMTKNVNDAEQAFNKVFDDASLQKQVNMQAFTAYHTEMLTNATVNGFRSKFSNITQLRNALKVYQPDAQHSAATILAYLEDVTTSSLHFQTNNDIGSGKYYDAADVAQLQDEVKKMESTLTQIEVLRQDVLQILDMLHNKDPAVLKNVDTLDKWQKYVTHIQEFNEIHANLKILNSAIKPHDLIVHDCSTFFITEPQFQAICQAQRCKSVDACNAMIIYAQKILKSRDELMSRTITSSQKDWLKDSVQQRLPHELAMFALAPFDNIVAANKSLQSYFKLPISEIGKQTIHNHLHAIVDEREAWQLLDARKVWLRNAAQTLQNVEHLLSRLNTMKQFEHNLPTLYAVEVNCAENILQTLNDGDFWEQITKVAQNMYTLFDLPIYDYNFVCNKTDNELIMSFQADLEQFVTPTNAWKQKVLASIASVADVQDMELSMLQSYLSELKVLVEIVNAPENIGQEKLLFLQILGVSSPLTSLRKHLHALQTSLENVVLVKEAMRDSDVTTSVIPDEAKKVHCAAMLTQNLTKYQQLTNGTLFALRKLLQTVDPTQKSYYLQFFVDLKPMLTCS